MPPLSVLLVFFWPQPRHAEVVVESCVKSGWNYLLGYPGQEVIGSMVIVSVGEIIHFYLLSHFGPWKKCLNFIFPIKYVIPKSLKVTHWLSQFKYGYELGLTTIDPNLLGHPRVLVGDWLILFNQPGFGAELFFRKPTFCPLEDDPFLFKWSLFREHSFIFRGVRSIFL